MGVRKSEFVEKKEHFLERKVIFSNEKMFYAINCLLHERFPAKENFAKNAKFRKFCFPISQTLSRNFAFSAKINVAKRGENDAVFREETKQSMRQFRQHFFISLA